MNKLKEMCNRSMFNSRLLEAILDDMLRASKIPIFYLDTHEERARLLRYLDNDGRFQDEARVLQQVFFCRQLSEVAIVTEHQGLEILKVMFDEQMVESFFQERRMFPEVGNLSVILIKISGNEPASLSVFRKGKGKVLKSEEKILLEEWGITDEALAGFKRMVQLHFCGS